MELSWQTLSPAILPQPQTGESVVRAALTANGSMSRLLDAAARSGEPVLLLVNDPHRSTQTRPALSAIAAIGRESPGLPRFRIVVATGAHRFPDDQRRDFERVMLTGCELQIEDVTWHNGADASSLAAIAGVRMSRLLVESRFVVPIGSVEPHYFAGVTGPHKTVTIGCMSVRDIERNHSLALDESSEVFRLQGNPVHEDMVGIIQRMTSGGKSVCAIGEVVRGSALLAAAAGDPLGVLEALLPTARQVFRHAIPRPVDVLRLRVPPPLGLNLYQADKALKNNHFAVRDRGAILLEAECREGLGPADFLTLLRQSDDYATVKRMVFDRGYRPGDHKALKLRHLLDPACRGVRVAVISPFLRGPDLEGTGIDLFPTVELALARLASTDVCLHRSGLIIEDAGMMNVVARANP